MIPALNAGFSFCRKNKEPVFCLLQIVDGVLCLFLGELLAVLGNQLVVNCGFGHGHFFIICFRFFEGVGFPVAFTLSTASHTSFFPVKLICLYRVS